MVSSSRDPDTADEPSNAPSSSTSSVNFTFVNQAEDVASLSRKKISNKDQRHTIRSHVMQRVRQVESAQGKKRSTGRENSKRPSPQKSKSTRPETHGQPATNDSTESLEVMASPRRRSAHSTGPPEDRKPGRSLKPVGSFPLNTTPAVHEFDPFDSLPTNRLPHQCSESLLQYCFDVLLPLTFSVEAKQTRDRLVRQGLVLKTKISNPATFLGFMATVAAHRAVLYGRHRDLAPSDANHDDLITDPDYAKVKHEAMIAVRQSFEQRAALDQHMVEACFGLISTATVVGNFEEARVHLKILARMTSQMDTSAESMMWLPISNVKVSVGLLRRPVLPLLLKRESISAEVLQRISPLPGTDLARLGSEFEHSQDLSVPIKELLSTSREVCRLCELNAGETRGLSSLENVTLRNKATELEFDLLAYPYEAPVFPLDEKGEPQIPAVESVVRLAALGFLSFAPHTIMPPTGLGRALTSHQRTAVERWRRERSATCEPSELKLLCWALFIFTQNSQHQREEIFFMDLLSQFSHRLRLTSWGEVETSVYGFLYIPSSQSPIWKKIWTEIRQIEDGSPVGTNVTSPTQ